MEFELLLKGVFYPSANSFLAPKSIFINPKYGNCCDASAILVELFLEWKWGVSMIDKASVCRILTDRDRGLTFLSAPPE